MVFSGGEILSMYREVLSSPCGEGVALDSHVSHKQDGACHAGAERVMGPEPTSRVRTVASGGAERQDGPSFRRVLQQCFLGARFCVCVGRCVSSLGWGSAETGARACVCVCVCV